MIRGWVLVSNEFVVSDDFFILGFRCFDEFSISIFDNSFKCKRYCLCEFDSFFFFVCESCDFFFFYQWFVIDFYIDKSGRIMVDGRNRFVGSLEFLDQLDVFFVGCEVEYGVVVIGVEQSSEFFGVVEEFFDGGSFFLEVFVVFEEVLGGFIFEYFDGVRVERGDIVFRRGDDDFGFGREDFVGVCEFRLLVGVEMLVCFLQNEVFF